MERTWTVPRDYRNCTLPFCLVSLSFLGIWPVFLLSYLLAMLGIWHYYRAPDGFIDLLFLFVPLPAIGFLALLSLIGSFLLVGEMKSRSLNWKAGIPLCALCCVFMVSALSYDPPYCCGQYTPVSGMICFVAFMSLPLGVNRVIREFRDPIFDEIGSFSKKVGFSGLVLSAVPILIEVIPFQIQAKIQMIFSGFFLAGLLLNIIFIFGLMPTLGIRLFRIRLRLR